MTIVVAHTATPEGAAALAAAVDAAVLRRSPVVVVSGEDPTAPPTVEDLLAGSETLARTVRDAGVSVEVRRSALPDAPDAVLQAAQELEAELLVIGVRRRSPVGKLFLGSTAQRILLDAQAPVLAVKA